MKNTRKFVGFSIIITLISIVIIALFEDALSVAASDAWYALAGLSFFIFGIWASVLLIKEENKVENEENKEENKEKEKK